MHFCPSAYMASTSSRLLPTLLISLGLCPDRCLTTRLWGSLSPTSWNADTWVPPCSASPPSEARLGVSPHLPSSLCCLCSPPRSWAFTPSPSGWPWRRWRISPGNSRATAPCPTSTSCTMTATWLPSGRLGSREAAASADLRSQVLQPQTCVTSGEWAACLRPWTERARPTTSGVSILAPGLGK